MQHSKKSPLIVKLRSFQNVSIEIKEISFVYQQNRFIVEKLICKMQNENSFTDKWFRFTMKRNPLILLKDLSETKKSKCFRFSIIVATRWAK